MVDDRKIKPRSQSINENQQWWQKFVSKCDRWSDINISRLLSIYRAYPLLWDATHSFYKDQPRRMEAYSIIAKKLNLFGIKERECIKLVESLKGLYAEEYKRQTIAKRCSQKYTPSPTWYQILKEMIECVQRRLAEPAEEAGLTKANPTKPWIACCGRLYTEDIWTPEHFKTNVMDYFITSHNEQLLCTCRQFSETTLDTEASSTYYRDSTSDSNSEIVQCVVEKPPHAPNICCFDIQNPKLPERCRVDINNDKTCGDTNEKKKGKIASQGNTKKCSVNTKGIDIQENSVEQICYGMEYSDNLSTTDKDCKIRKRQKNRKRKLILCEKNMEHKINCEEDTSVLDPCGSKAVDKSQNAIHTCRKNNISLSENSNTSREAGWVNYEIESLNCGHKPESNKQFLRQCSYKQPLKSCGVRIFRPCGSKKFAKFCTTKITAHGNESIASSKSEASSMSESLDTCHSDSDGTPVTGSGITSQSSLLLLECKSISQKEKSDHRLDDIPDPTLCEKCAADRLPVRKEHNNIVHYEDPRMPELDKYCYYKNWDAIYNIRTQVPEEEPIILVDKDCLLTTEYKDKPSKTKRQNHLLTEADINLFIDPKSSNTREVSLHNEYKREYGLNIQIEQPRHYACEASEDSDHKPAQLIL